MKMFMAGCNSFLPLYFRRRRTYVFIIRPSSCYFITIPTADSSNRAYLVVSFTHSCRFYDSHSAFAYTP